MHLEDFYALPGFEQDSYQQTKEQILLKQTEKAFEIGDVVILCN